MRGQLRLPAACVIAAGIVAITVGPAGAAPQHEQITAVVVTTTVDEQTPNDGKVSLREAIDQANASSAEIDIVLAAHATYALTRCPSGADDDGNTVGDLDHFGGGVLTISGNGSTIRQTCSSSRVFDQLGPSLLNLTDLTISGGHAAAEPGGGVFVRGGGELQLKNDVISGNLSEAAGGGVASFGSTTITGTTISLNQSTELAGGIASIGPMILVRSIVSGNTAPLIGGVAASAGLHMAYSTVQDNSVPNIDVQEGGMTSFGSVVGVIRAPAPGSGPPAGGGGAAPPGGFGPPPTTTCHVNGAIVSLGYNADLDGSCGFGSTGDRSTVGDPRLRPESGAATPLIVPQAGSPLIDAIPASACLPASVQPWLPSWSPLQTDIRGLVRPQGGGCDIGAVEVGKVATAPCLVLVAAPKTVRHGRKVTLTVTLGSGKAKVRIHLSGAGLNASAKTSARGKAVFRVRPGKAGKILASAGGSCRATIPVH